MFVLLVCVWHFDNEMETNSWTARVMLLRRDIISHEFIHEHWATKFAISQIFVAHLLFMLNGLKLISSWYSTRQIFTQQPYTVVSIEILCIQPRMRKNRVRLMVEHLHFTSNSVAKRTKWCTSNEAVHFCVPCLEVPVSGEYISIQKSESNNRGMTLNWTSMHQQLIVAQVEHYSKGFCAAKPPWICYLKK